MRILDIITLLFFINTVLFISAFITECYQAASFFGVINSLFTLYILIERFVTDDTKTKKTTNSKRRTITFK